MSDVTIYHNPQCSKCRQTLSLLRERGIEPLVVEYLKTPPDVATLRQLLTQLDIRPRDLIREKEHRALGLSDTEDEAELLARMANHPEIIQRPIVVCGGKARLGRPPENVVEIL